MYKPIVVEHPIDDEQIEDEQTVTLLQLVNAIERRQDVLACMYQGEVVNEDSPLMQHFVVDSIATLKDAKSNQLSFLAQKRYAKSLIDTKAGVVIVNDSCKDGVPSCSIAIVVKSPYLAYATITSLFEKNHNSPIKTPLIHATAIVADSVHIGQGVQIGAYCIVEDNVTLGDYCQVSAHVSIGHNVVIGAQTIIKPHVSIAHHCEIGSYVRIHENASIGSEGFGFAPSNDPAQYGWERIVQLGKVIIGDHVRIGSQTCIDRGAIEDTVIGDHVIIDNLVQIAHNVHIGSGTAIAAMTGIAGSATIGKRCLVGGASSINGHINITDDVILNGRTYVVKSINKSGSYGSAMVAMPSAHWRRAAINLKKMGEK